MYRQENDHRAPNGHVEPGAEVDVIALLMLTCCTDVLYLPTCVPAYSERGALVCKISEAVLYAVLLPGNKTSAVG